MVKFLSEESVFICLTWFHPTLSGIIVSMLLGENFLLESNKSSTSLFLYSSCSKVKFHKEQFMQSMAYSMFSVSSVAIVIATVLIHISLFIKHRKLKGQRADGNNVVTYNDKDGTLISKTNEDQSLFQKLWRHERSVVTPQASQLSFIIRLLGIPSAAVLFYMYHSSGLPPWAQLYLYTIFVQCFLWFNLIEAFFSPNLRNSLKEFLFFKHPQQINMPPPLEECLKQRSISIKTNNWEVSFDF